MKTLLSTRILALILLTKYVNAFTPSCFQSCLSLQPQLPQPQQLQQPQHIPSPLQMAGFGGAASATKTKSKKGKNKNKKKTDQASFDASAALIRSEKLYDKMVTENAKQMLKDDDEFSTTTSTTTNNRVLSEFVVAARYNPKSGSIAGSSSVSDWTPVAQICLERSRFQKDNHDNDRLPSQLTEAISVHCREIHHAAVTAAPIFASLPRQDVEYSVETLDSFFKHVHDFVLLEQTTKKKKTNGDGEQDIEHMTTKEARNILEVDPNCFDLNQIKKAYRTLSFQYHPDRFMNTNMNNANNNVAAENDEETREAAKQEAQTKYLKVKHAYELLVKSGLTASTAPSDSSTNASSTNDNSNGAPAPASTTNSWYAALGGRERTDFKGPLELIQLKVAQSNMDRCINTLGGYRSAVCALDPELVNSFTSRNQANAVRFR